MRKGIFVALLTVMLTGCAVLIPERHNANLVMGHDVSSAYQYFGQPRDRYIETSDGPHKGETVYVWQKLGGSYSADKLVGSDFYYGDGGQPTVVNSFQRNTYVVACVTKMWVNEKNVVDYYEISGDCGIGMTGLGNTGKWHQQGID